MDELRRTISSERLHPPRGPRRPPNARPALALAISVIALAAPNAPAAAQTGVSDDRVSLPDGPGSIEGLGDNASVAPNMGAMSYSVDFEVPHGFEGVTPDLSLVYGSGYGNGIAGIGWYLPLPSIERLTLRGLPTYDADDEFAADAAEQLVRIASAGGDAVYRARFEGAFVRYTWHDVGDAGYWVAEYPDGRVGYFGADADGTIVSDARLSGPDGETFRYHLVEVVDPYGHRMRFAYEREAGTPYCTSIEYVFDDEDAPRYVVELGYEGRPDPISDAKPGFEERVARRLAEVRVSANGEVIRTYVLSYEDADDAGGLSRLVMVELFGRDGGRYPVAHAFGYSRALGGVCSAGSCDGPFVVDMGTLPIGGSILAGDATLVDINGDALPDVVDTSQPGAHRFVLNRLGDGGTSYFDSTVVVSAVGDRSGFRASDPTVKVLDLNGDGFADMINTFGGGSVLCNYGTGDWSTEGCVLEDNLDLELTADEAGGADPRYTRFLDVDNDRRIDVVRTGTPETIQVSRNHGAGFEPLPGAEPIGAAFDEVRLFLADMNGDGLLDPIQVFDVGSPQYRLNLGFARWGDWRTIDAPDVDLADRDFILFEDLNDDGRDDFVLVVPGSGVRYALNRDGATFGELVTLGPEDVPELPIRGINTTVLFADMNGNGSRDVVWIETSGKVRYLELFPVPPNLLSRIENGIGGVQEIHYGTAVAQRADDGAEWSHPLAQAMSVVERIDSWVTLTGGEDGAGLHDVTYYRYRDGFYDGDEKAFRGFARVETTSPRDSDDDTQEPGRTVLEFDVGDTDPYRHGLALRRETFSGEGAAERALEETRTEYDDCDVAGVPASGLLFDVRFVCETAQVEIRKEGAPAAEWATIRTEVERDGYGNVTLEANLGVVHMGSPESPTACAPCERDPDAFGAPCGESCLGDEAYVSTAYVVPGTDTGGRYLLGRPHTVRRYGREGGASTEETIYYDGPAYIGLAKGKLTLGNPTRVTARVDEGSSATVDVARSAYDADGNVIGTIDPNGTVADTTTHRRTYQYDSTGLRVIRTDVHLRSPEDVPYVLRREYSYDPAFDEVSESTAWMVIESGTALSARNATRYRYDEFGRRIAVLEPGDPDDAPTTVIAWELGDPASAVRVRTRSVLGGPLDLERMICHDGLGRAYQRRTRLDETTFQVDGFVEYNARGEPLRVYETYEAAGAACATSAPATVRYERIHYDAAGRETARELADAELHGSASVRANEHAPLATRYFDEEDSDPESPYVDTPTTVHLDGIGRAVAIERRLAAATPGTSIVAHYDELGRLRTLIDAAGHRKEQRYDALGRLIGIDDPNAGASSFEYDPAGNLVLRVDARGVATGREYDGANRLVAEWNDADRAGTEIRVRYDRGGTCAATSCTHTAGRPIELRYPVSDAVLARLGGAAHGVDHFGYDARGRGAYEARTVAGLALVTRFERDNAGRVGAVVHPDGQRIEYRYDRAARPSAIEGIVDELIYDERGLLTEARFANGAQDSWAYDVRAQLVRSITLDAARSPIVDRVYERDRAANVVAVTDAAEPPPSWSPFAIELDHDAWYRVTKLSIRGGEAAGGETQSFGYDAIDNLVSVVSSAGSASSGHLGDLEYDHVRANAVVRAGSLTLGYDESGHLSERGDAALEWDFLGRLTSAVRRGETFVELGYASGASRVSKVEGGAVTLYVDSDFELRDGIGVAYARIGERRVARIESSTLATALLGDPAPVVGGDGRIDAADAWVAHAAEIGIVDADVEGAARAPTMLRSAARRLLLEAGDDFAVLHADHLGSLVAATDVDGNVRGRRRYGLTDGEDREDGHVDVYGFTGQEDVDSIGLVRFEHRWLDPTTRRWTRPDPLFFAAAELDATHADEAADPYAYVGNAFASAIDPDGLSPKTRRMTALERSRTIRARVGRLVTNMRSMRDAVRARVAHTLASAWMKVRQHVVRLLADAPATRHDRRTEYPSHFSADTWRTMATEYTSEGRAGQIPPHTNVYKMRAKLHWDDGSGNRIQARDLTFDHEVPVVQHWNDGDPDFANGKRGREMTQRERNDWYNHTSNLRPMPRSRNSAHGGRLGAHVQYSQETLPGYSR